MTSRNQTREKIKSSRFKDSFDEEFNWEDRMEMMSRRRKKNRKSMRRNSFREKW